MVIFEKKSLLLQNARKKVCFTGNFLVSPHLYQMATPLFERWLAYRSPPYHHLLLLNDKWNKFCLIIFKGTHSNLTFLFPFFSYFSVESTQEMLDEWRPLMCPFDVTMMKAMYFCELFLPTMLPPEHHDQGFRLAQIQAPLGLFHSKWYRGGGSVDF